MTPEEWQKGLDRIFWRGMLGIGILTAFSLILTCILGMVL